MEKKKPVGWQKDPDQKVTQQLKVYVTEREEIQLKQNAKILGMSFSSFARRVLTEEELNFEPKELKRIRYELNKIGVNLNQLAKKANENDRLPEAQRLRNTCHQLIEKLEEL